VRIRARDDDAEVGVVRPAGPDLLSVEYPIVADAFGTRLDPSEIGTRNRLAEELAPNVVAARERGQVMPLLFVARERHQRGPAHALADHEKAVRRHLTTDFLAPNH